MKQPYKLLPVGGFLLHQRTRGMLLGNSISTLVESQQRSLHWERCRPEHSYLLNKIFVCLFFAKMVVHKGENMDARETYERFGQHSSMCSSTQ